MNTVHIHINFPSASKAARERTRRSLLRLGAVRLKRASYAVPDLKGKKEQVEKIAATAMECGATRAAIQTESTGLAVFAQRFSRSSEFALLADRMQLLEHTIDAGRADRTYAAAVLPIHRFRSEFNRLASLTMVASTERRRALGALTKLERCVEIYFLSSRVDVLESSLKALGAAPGSNRRKSAGCA